MLKAGEGGWARLWRALNAGPRSWALFPRQQGAKEEFRVRE